MYITGAYLLLVIHQRTYKQMPQAIDHNIFFLFYLHQFNVDYLENYHKNLSSTIKKNKNNLLTYIKVGEIHANIIFHKLYLRSILY